MKAQLLGLDGKKKKEVTLPEVFEAEYRPGLIKRAVVSLQSRRLQPHAPAPEAGFQTTATYVGRRSAFRSGINKGISRRPRVKLGGGGLGAVRIVPGSVGGRRAHPPKVEKVLVKRINKKEKRLAMRSAIAATANKELVEKRGHKVKVVPLVVEENISTLKKTKEVIVFLKKAGLEQDLERAKKKKRRAGKGTKRGRTYKKKKGVLIVVAEDKGIKKAAGGIPGVNVSTVISLNIEMLAPGTHAGRAVVWSESAVKQVGEKYGA